MEVNNPVLKGRLQRLKTWFLKRRFTSQGKRMLSLTYALPWGAWFQGWSLLFWSETSIYTPIENKALSLTKLPSWIGVENGILYPIKEGPTLKPSSARDGTCQGQNSFNLGSPISVQT